MSQSAVLCIQHSPWTPSRAALTVVRNAVLQPRQLRRSALRRAGDEALAQLLAPGSLLFNVPSRSHVELST
jgi:hypothetical protein